MPNSLPLGIDSRCRELVLHQGLDALRVNFAARKLRAFCVTSGKAPTLGGGGTAAVTGADGFPGCAVLTKAIDAM